MALQHRKDTAPARQGLLRRDPWSELFTDPFSAFGLGSPLDRWFGGQPGSRIGRDTGMWAPQIESFQRGNEFIIRADLPGMKKEDINVELGSDAVTIHGERRDEHQEEHEGYYRTERSYGSFYRTVPLPEGAISDNARAEFKDGVLEIAMAAPPHETRKGRKLEIK